MAIDAIKKLKLFSAKTAPGQKMQKLAKGIKLAGNVTQILSVMRLLYLQTKKASTGLQNDEFMRLISETTESNLSEVQQAVSETERNIQMVSLERDVARKFQKLNKAINPKIAIIARVVAEWAQHQHLELAFMSGLLSKVGTEEMSASDRLGMAKVVSRVFQGSSRKEAEIIEFGFDHGQLMSIVLKEHAFPQAIVETLSLEPEQAKDKELIYIVQFAEFLAKVFNDKTKSPSKIWTEAQQHLKNLHLNITKEEWADKISSLFVKALEFELSL